MVQKHFFLSEEALALQLASHAHLVITWGGGGACDGRSAESTRLLQLPVCQERDPSDSVLVSTIAFLDIT